MYVFDSLLFVCCVLATHKITTHKYIIKKQTQKNNKQESFPTICLQTWISLYTDLNANVVLSLFVGFASISFTFFRVLYGDHNSEDREKEQIIAKRLQRRMGVSYINYHKQSISKPLKPEIIKKIDIYKWQWYSDTDGWQDYPPELSNKINDSYDNKNDKFAYNMFEQKYEILFEHMNQYNLVTNRLRPVKRVLLNEDMNDTNHVATNGDNMAYNFGSNDDIKRDDIESKQQQHGDNRTETIALKEEIKEFTESPPELLHVRSRSGTLLRLASTTAEKVSKSRTCRTLWRNFICCYPVKILVDYAKDDGNMKKANEMKDPLKLTWKDKVFYLLVYIWVITDFGIRIFPILVCARLREHALEFLAVMFGLTVFEFFLYYYMLWGAFKTPRFTTHFFWTLYFTVSYCLLSTMYLVYLPANVKFDRLLVEHCLRMMIQCGFMIAAMIIQYYQYGDPLGFFNRSIILFWITWGFNWILTFIVRFFYKRLKTKIRMNQNQLAGNNPNNADKMSMDEMDMENTMETNMHETHVEKMIAEEQELTVFNRVKTGSHTFHD